MRGRRIRSVSLILAGIMLGAITIAPAFAHHTPKHTKKMIKKLAKNIKKVKANTYTKAEADGMFFPASELHTFGPLNMQVGAAAIPVLQAGPFTLTARCADIGGDVVGGVYIATSAAGSAMSSNDEPTVAPFGPGDGEKEWGTEDGAPHPPGGAPDAGWHGDSATANAPDGTTLFGHTSAARNIGGAHCLIAGHVFVHAP